MSDEQTAKKVLVVEDDEDVRDLIGDMLREMGWLVEVACDGAEAIEKLGRSRPDLLLLDLALPRVDGWGVLLFLSTDPDPPVVVLVTASGAELARLHSEAPARVAAVIRKPFRFTELVTTCEQALARDPCL